MGDAYAAVHETVTWLGAGGGGIALVHMARAWLAAQRQRKNPSTPPPPMATVQDVRALAGRVDTLERDPRSLEQLRRDVDDLRKKLAEERTKRYELQRDVQNFLRQEEDAWRQLERTLGRLEGQLEAMRDK